MGATRKSVGRAASVALARKRMHQGGVPGTRASATIPAAMLAVVPGAEQPAPAASTDPAAPVPQLSSLGRIMEGQREALRRLDALERLVQHVHADIASMRLALGIDAGHSEPDAVPAEPDAPEQPTPVEDPAQPVPAAPAEDPPSVPDEPA